MFEEARAKLGPVTHLVNNAGVLGPKGENASLLGADAATQMEAILDVFRSVCPSFLSHATDLSG
jgi:NAD(P)-dependent dehydrogenase (short-subunit alcohol dehydrogenase family)